MFPFKLIVDSREKKNNHIVEYLENHNISYTIQKMDVADYQLQGKNSLAVDRKQNLDELLQNLATSDKGRFYREIRLAHKRKIKLYVLCEHGGNIKSLQDVKMWKSKYSVVSGAALKKMIEKVKFAYDVTFLFCDKSETAKTIIEILCK